MDTEIKRRRIERGLTQEEVAKRLEVAPATVSRWEREPGRVTVPILRNLAMILNCEPAELLAPAPKYRSHLETGQVVYLREINGGAEVLKSIDCLRAYTDAPVERLAAMRVVGDAMAPTIRDGDLCVVDTGSGFDQNGLYCLGGPGFAYIRRLAVRANGREVSVIADNPSYAEVEIVPIADLPIIGRVLTRTGPV